MHTLSYPKHFLFYITVVKGKTLVKVENVWVFRIFTFTQSLYIVQPIQNFNNHKLFENIKQADIHCLTDKTCRRTLEYHKNVIFILLIVYVIGRYAKFDCRGNKT